MKPSVFVAVSTLPVGLRRALSSVGYHRSDVTLWAKEAELVFSAGARGRRGYAVVVPDINQVTHEVHWGSWGGPNMYSGPTEALVDSCREPQEVPAKGAIVIGYSGKGRPTSAEISVRPETFASMLQYDLGVVANDAAIEGRANVVNAIVAECLPSANLLPVQLAILEVYATIRSSYRNQFLQGIALEGRSPNGATFAPIGRPAVEDEINALVTAGYLKRNKTGATSITMLGKNARRR